MELLADPLIELVSSSLALLIYCVLLLVRYRPGRKGATKTSEELDTFEHVSPTEESVVTPSPTQTTRPAQPEFIDVVTSEPEVRPELDLPTEVVKPSKAPPAASVKDRLGKSRTGIFASLQNLFSFKSTISVELLEELEFLLVSSDLGIKTAKRLIGEVRESLSKGETVTEELLISRMQRDVEKTLTASSENQLEQLHPGQLVPKICLIVGVNGVGKTTTTAKLAQRLKEKGLSVLLVAADTFRAAAVKQLQTWGERLGVEVVSGAENAKPQTVVFEAMQRAQATAFDVILIDTAGRLNNKSNLMQELSGVKNAVEKHFPAGVAEVLMVVDATTGQNAVSQAREFHGAVDLTGMVVTKLDGTPKGGVVVAVTEEVAVPVRYIGIGESAEDLRPFSAQEFSEALFSREEKTEVTDSAHAEVRRRRRSAA